MSPDTDNDALITPARLKILAGEAACRRGEKLHADGAVSALEPGARRSTATVTGAREHHVVLEHGDGQLGGHCDCDESEGFDFCQHCVAAALKLAELQREAAALAEGGERERIEAYLLQLDRRSLVDALLERLDEDPDQMRQWRIRAELSDGELRPGTLRKHITRALPYRQLWRYAEVRRYFSTAMAAMEPVLEALPALPGAEALELLDYAYLRLNKALDRVDDSGGFRFPLEKALSREYAAAFSRVDWSDEERADALVRALLEREDVGPDVDALSRASTALRAAYIAAVDARWRGAPKSERGSGTLERLRSTLVEDAQAAGDRPRLIALKSPHAETFHDFAELFELCLSSGDNAAAEHWLEQARAQSEGWQTDRSEQMAIALHRARGEAEAALERQWRLFETRLEVGDYQMLVEISREAGEDIGAARDRAESILIERADSGGHIRRSEASKPLIAFYLANDELDKAVEAAQRYPVELSQLDTIVERIRDDDPSTALALARRLVAALTDRANRSSYEEAVSILTRIEKSTAAPGFEAARREFNTFLRELCRTHVRRRSFTGMLDRAFDLGL